ncbi:MAG TPA: DNA cytosine methyltransferase [bacterium]|nr:DNA cytosine methyltransferase [bacterium]
MTSNFSYIDIFAGCGGLSFGLHKAGWRGLFAIEKSPMAFSTLKHNLIDSRHHFDWPEWLPQNAIDINIAMKSYKAELLSLKGKVEMVAGGPPCQGFSFAGMRDRNDKRNQLVHSYIDFIKIIEPEIVFFENVTGFNARVGDHEPYAKTVERKIEHLGYYVCKKMVQFKDFGIPQRRERFILIGLRAKKATDFFPLLAKNKTSFLKVRGLTKTVTTMAAISDLEMKNGTITSPDSENFMAGKYGRARTNYQKLMRKNNGSGIPDSHRFANHVPSTIERFQYVIDNSPRGKMIPKEIKEIYGLKKMTTRLIDHKAPCPTLTTLPDDYIHYSEPRILTVREYARIQSFDDDYEFKSKYTTGGDRRATDVPRYTQIGNAIPPMFMEQAGNVLKEMIR